MKSEVIRASTGAEPLPFRFKVNATLQSTEFGSHVLRVREITACSLFPAKKSVNDYRYNVRN